MSKVMIELVGDALSLTLPGDVGARLGLHAGQEMMITPTADGIRLTKVDPALEHQLGLIDDVLREQEVALRALASR